MSRLIFIDETWAKTNMTRLRGRAPIGQRLLAKIPFGHWKTTTLIAALDSNGVRCSTVVDGAVNGDVFEAFVKQVLLPQLTVGDVVILDNLSSHRRASIRTLIESAGAQLLFLPPYSPDLNPIEKAFSKLKSLLRKVQKRTIRTLQNYLGAALDNFSPEECRNYFTSCGYNTAMPSREPL